MAIIVLADIVIEDPAIVLCHIQCAMSHQLLEHECVPSTVQKILTGKGMPEFVDGCAFYASTFVVPGDCVSESILCQHTAIHITEKRVFRFSATDSHIFPEDACHKAAKGNDLNLAVFVMTESDLHGGEIHILVLNVADC